MGSKIYVDGLPYSTTEQQQVTCSRCTGPVTSARIVRTSSRGSPGVSGFVRM